MVEPDVIGRRLPSNALNLAVRSALESFSFQPVTLSLSDAAPAVTKALAESLKAEVARMVSGDLSLTFEKQTFVLSRFELLSFVELAADATALSGVVGLLSTPKIIQRLSGLAVLDREAGNEPVLGDFCGEGREGVGGF